ncbi:membrane protein [Clostridiisalibacter paucivorans]|uniref:membrane protein n=1 Tax=Clostridiisalibacter paucivorans TaxID=408753 RepID=UPI0004790284|nr:membrane protein [Clostridiisalibacter paucivorans]
MAKSVGRKKSFFDGAFGRYLIPGIVLQSVLIGGGYATGREIVAFGAKFGALGWLGGLGIFIGFTLISVLTFEIARIYRTYNYKSLVKQIAGKLSVVYDVIYILLSIIIIAVMSSATGEIVNKTLGLSYWVGVGGVVVLVGILNFYGSWLIERFETYGTIALYIGYIIFSVIVISSTRENIHNVFINTDTSYIQGSIGIGTVLWTGIVYVGYNVVVYPATLFTLERQTKRRETIISGIISGVLMTIPWFMTYFSIMGYYPSKDILEAGVPWLGMLQKAGGSWVIAVFGMVMGWTFIETSTGILHALAERIDGGLREIGKKTMTNSQKAGLTVGVLIFAMGLSKIGIVDLISKGYTLMAYGMILVYAIPLLTIGLYKIIKHDKKTRIL